MKKIIVFIVVAMAFMATCTPGFEKIGDYTTEETVYPGKFDTIIAFVGYNRIELELFKEGRIPASQIVLGKAKKTVVEILGVDEPLVWDSICSWVSIGGLTEPRLYRFKVYTIDEFGNKSVPQEIAEVPFTEADIEKYDEVPTPKISPSPFSSTFSWLSISNPLMNYAGLKYEYMDRDGELRTGSVAADEEINFHMQNLEGEKNYTCDVYVRVIPFRGEIPIIDTIDLKRSYTTITNSEDEYIKDRRDKYRRIEAMGWTEGSTVFWEAESDPTQVYSVVQYMDYSDPINPVQTEITVLRNEMLTLLPGVKHGDPITWYSVYTPFGSIEEVETDHRNINTTPLDEDGLLFINRKYWYTLYTFSGGLSTDGTRLPGVRIEDAHIDDSQSSYLGMSKKGKESNNAQGGREAGFIMDLKYVTLFNRLCWTHRNEATTIALYWWGIDLWGTNEYLGPRDLYANPPTVGSLDDDPNTQWTLIKRIDLGIDRNGNPTPDGAPPASYSPALKPTLYAWQAPLIDLGKDCSYRYVKVTGYKFDYVNSNKACVSDFRLYYQAE